MQELKITDEFFIFALPCVCPYANLYVRPSVTSRYTSHFRIPACDRRTDGQTNGQNG